MQQTKWESPEQLRALLEKLVSWDSRTGTKGEIDFPYKLKDTLFEQQYFQDNPTHVKLHDAGRDRHALTALYKSEQTNNTIVLMSHFDTVHTEEFGDLRDMAFQIEALTEVIKKQKSTFPVEAQTDIETDEYLFGRGTMDMKMGLVLHMHLLEQANKEQWPINLLLVTVPDEEVNSAGMRAAVEGLTTLREKESLDFQIFLNSEPSFSQEPRDEQYYIYSGTIGKIMPSALFYGRATHAGEPLSGLTGHYMNTYLTQAMEFNEDFVEESHGEETPLPICLQTNDLKQDYSAQTSHHSYALYNVFVMNRNAQEVMEIFKATAEQAMKACQEDYEAICQRKGVEPIGTINVLTYDELYTHAEQKMGVRELESLTENVLANDILDDRQKSVQLSDTLMMHCPELAPVTVLFYAPPYYPAVNSSDNSFVQDMIVFAQQTLKERFNVSAKQIHYFNGISDLSYVNYSSKDRGWVAYQRNTPVWGDVYSIPFEAMQTLQSPVMNIGPFGKDAHKVTERLHKESAFIQTPYVLKQVIKRLFEKET